MKVSHVLYKVENLDSAVQEFREKGFEVEYCSKKNCYNALIYFSDGPYLELIGDVRLPYIARLILRLLGKSKLVDRIEQWHFSKEGTIGVCLENDKRDLEEEKKILKKYHQKFFSKPTKRIDIKGRVLAFQVLFPDNVKIPFLMTRFSIDPKPKNFVHKNSVIRIKGISFGTDEKLIPLIRELCDDDLLTLFIGEGVKDLVYEEMENTVTV